MNYAEKKFTQLELILMVIVAFGVGAFLFSGGGANVHSNNDNAIGGEAGAPALFGDSFSITDEDSVYGKRGAEITIIEYSDLECPFCARFHPTAKSIVDESSGNVSWVYRHLPLPIHNSAFEGAVIAECVKENLGNESFWSFTDGIFLSNITPTVEIYESLATDLGLNRNTLNNCYQSESKETATVRSHLNDAQALGLNGTPSGFIVNTDSGKFRRLQGAIPKEHLIALINEIK